MVGWSGDMLRGFCKLSTHWWLKRKSFNMIIRLAILYGLECWVTESQTKQAKCSRHKNIEIDVLEPERIKNEFSILETLHQLRTKWWRSNWDGWTCAITNQGTFSKETFCNLLLKVVRRGKIYGIIDGNCKRGCTKAWTNKWGSSKCECLGNMDS